MTSAARFFSASVALLTKLAASPAVRRSSARIRVSLSSAFDMTISFDDTTMEVGVYLPELTAVGEKGSAVELSSHAKYHAKGCGRSERRRGGAWNRVLKNPRRRRGERRGGPANGRQ